ncbi:MAG: phosphohistidine phosphatase SixA [Bacteroidetes bacterium]|jgi:phosphohistidine phosphatase|nr:phosphohistidine phosphatase SixA [Bacteroidota bacterium]
MSAVKELILVRHAKSDWGTEFLRDIDRPLNERGYSDAYFMSKWFQKNHAVPQRIISSTATRALNTALIFARTLDFNMDTFFLEKNVYESSVKNLISIISRQPAEVESLMLFGHNPTLTEACNQLIKDFFIDNVPTCGVVGMKFSISDWAEVADKTADLSFHQFPKNFKNTD